MCVDYTDLNKACPKDEYPLLRIDQIVDSTSGCELLCFLDAYLRYDQISMCIDDEEKTAFVTPFGMYCYIKMPFGLKNAGSTYKNVFILFLKARSAAMWKHILMISLLKANSKVI